jgi:outer membrane receptor for ferrienterochelin and colicins
MTAGLQNVFTAYQQNFNFGAERNADYIYNPFRPTSLVLGLNFKTI